MENEQHQFEVQQTPAQEERDHRELFAALAQLRDGEITADECKKIVNAVIDSAEQEKNGN